MHIINNKPKPFSQELKTVWRALPIAMVFAKRAIRIKYSHTALGLLWVIVPIAAYVVIYSVFFSVLLEIDTRETPYPLIAFSGLLGWNYFKDIIHNVGPSLHQEGEYLKKNVLPKFIIPLYKSLLGLVELGISLGLFFILMLIYREPLRLSILILPVLIIINQLLGFSIGIWVCNLSGRRRDVVHLAISGLNVAIWLTPVFYLPGLLPEVYEPFLYLNPMTTLIGAYRWTLLGLSFPPAYAWAALLIWGVVLVAGIRTFFRRQYELIDYL
ncbi:ABC transporter permease [Phaeodactylibacter xiamenensis]|uniref:ABC transporter permease n=1 Tax=Phaeodactylibacter xiamenensis TaxID=1524460 RepID=UPI0024A9A3C5|nr:ABC transporter permease [Phaeodactylibacter xiamenensis]